MRSRTKTILRRSAVAIFVAATLIATEKTSSAQERGQERPLFISVGEATRAPIGWVEFCVEYDPECKTKPSAARDVVLSSQAWKDLVRINRAVNTSVKPMTDYVLQKRKMLMQAGWPREALLITVVRDKNNDGHAVLTVKSDKGEYVLDNQTDDIVLWSDTGYRFVMRQSQSDPNVWVALGEPRPAGATAASR